MDLDELKRRRQRIAEWQPDSHEGWQSKVKHMREVDAQISREEDLDDQLCRRRNAEMATLQERERELLDEITRYDYDCGPRADVERLGPSGATLHELTRVREEMRQFRNRTEIARRALAEPPPFGWDWESILIPKLEPHK